MIGKTILHYKIIDKLGEGGMGVVYKAEDTKLKRNVAIKFLPRQIGASDEERERFKIEAQAAAALNHPNIATIYAIEEVDDDTFIVMEYIEGKELRHLIKSPLEGGARRAGGVITVDDVVNYASQIASGLQAAHEKGVTHRDIKSANVMITDKGQVKIMDFGLAKVRGSALLTKVGTTLGTAAYMSPEQARSEEADHRSDIWSFGVVLYEMLTGKFPFGGDYEQAVMYAIMNEEPEPVSVLCPEVSEALQRIVKKTLAKNRDARYQTVQDVLADLKALQGSGAPTLTGFRTLSGLSKARWPMVAIGVAVIAFLAILGALWFKSSEPEPDATAKSIAVLPFTDMSPERDQEYFGDGMAEAIINALAQIPGLKVSARTSAFQFKGGESDIQSIGEKLGVKTVLEGSVAKSGDKLRVTAQLITVADGFHLWSQTYDRELTDIFTIQDELSRSIVEALEVKLSVDKAEPATRNRTMSVEAYNLYLKGRYFWNRRTEAGLQKSIGFFQQAIDLDSAYALAYAGLADAYSILGAWRYVAPNEGFARAKSAAQKALDLDDSLAEAYAALAFAKFNYDWDWPGAEHEFKRALALKPTYASAHQWYAELLSLLGRRAQALAEVRKALDLDPLSLIINAVLGELYMQAGDDDQAIKQFKKTLEMDPDFIPAHSWLFQSYFRKGDYDAACNHFIVAYSAFYDLGNQARQTARRLYRESGWPGVVRFMIATHEALAKEKYVSPERLGVLYTVLGDHERALDAIEKAYQERVITTNRLGVFPVYASLYSEPRFQALLKKLGLPR